MLYLLVLVLVEFEVSHVFMYSAFVKISAVWCPTAASGSNQKRM